MLSRTPLNAKDLNEFEGQLQKSNQIEEKLDFVDLPQTNR
jgi:hypothetical protein